MEESDLHLHLSREASDPAAHQDETRFIVNQYRRMPERIWAYIWAADRRRAAVGACRNSFGCSATPAPNDAGHDVVGQRGAVVARAYRRAVAEQQCPAAERPRYDELRRCGLPGRDL